MNTPPPTPSSAPSFLGIELGTWPAWASVVVAALAALVAVSTYRRGVREKTEAQARLVYGSRVGGLPAEKGHLVGEAYGVGAFLESRDLVNYDDPDGWCYAADVCPMQVLLHNESDEVVLRWSANWWPLDDRGSSALKGCFPRSVAPKGTEAIAFVGSDRFYGPSTFTLYFMDSSGRYWRRGEGGPVTRIAAWQLDPPQYWPESRGWYGDVRRWLHRPRVRMRGYWSRFVRWEPLGNRSPVARCDALLNDAAWSGAFAFVTWHMCGLPVGGVPGEVGPDAAGHDVVEAEAGVRVHQVVVDGAPADRAG